MLGWQLYCHPLCPTWVGSRCGSNRSSARRKGTLIARSITMRYALTIAGGSGTRLWPMSRAALPKQLIPLIGGRSLLEIAIGRLEGLVPPERCWSAPERRTRRRSTALCPNLAPNSFSASLAGATRSMRSGSARPCSRGATRRQSSASSPPTTLSSRSTSSKRSSTPATPWSNNTRRPWLPSASPPPARPPGMATWNWATVGWLGAAFAAIPGEARSGDRTTILRGGAREVPLEQRDVRLAGGHAVGVHPPLRAAELRRADADRRRLGHAARQAVLEEVYPTLKKISVDFAVMEPASRDAAVTVAAIPMPLRWLDVGSWPSLAQTCPQDEQGNFLAAARTLLMDTRRTLAASSDPGHLIAAIGCDDLVIVHTPDATLVCRADCADADQGVAPEARRPLWRRVGVRRAGTSSRD